MKVFRFMSIVEFEKYKRGLKLENTTVHKGKTNSVGFCFLSMDDYTPEEAMHFLSGIATFDICAVFETEEPMKKTYGIYAKPIKRTRNPIQDIINLLDGFQNSFRATEYCIKEYDKEKFKLIKYSSDIWKQWDTRENQPKLNF